MYKRIFNKMPNISNSLFIYNTFLKKERVIEIGDPVLTFGILVLFRGEPTVTNCAQRTHEIHVVCF